MTTGVRTDKPEASHWCDGGPCPDLPSDNALGFMVIAQSRQGSRLSRERKSMARKILERRMYPNGWGYEDIWFVCPPELDAPELDATALRDKGECATRNDQELAIERVKTPSKA